MGDVNRLDTKQSDLDNVNRYGKRVGWTGRILD